jgi:cell division protein FtsW
MYNRITEKINPHYVTTRSGAQKAVGKEPAARFRIAGQSFGIWRINGAYRWIILGPVNFQPSVFLKVVLIILTALKLSQIPDEEGKKRAKFYRRRGETVEIVSTFRDSISKNKEIIIFALAAVVLVLVQPSNSVAASIFLALLAMFALKYSRFINKILPPVLFAAAVLFFCVWNINSNFRDRITKGGDNYQSRQALLAIGSGGILGLGIGNGEAKYNRLPEIENDYIFSIIAEETGFVGAIIFLGIYVCFIFTGFKTAISAQDKFCKLTAFGITSNYALSFMFHLFVNLGFVSTGASLPFVSYGGTAIIADAISLGILLNISSLRYERIRA